jgi:tRNA(Arg) A34 adenosine deaminase TadA
MQQQSENAVDRGMMERCIELSRTAVAVGELPFASIIARGDEIIASAINRVARDRDVTRHAELLTISAAQKTLGKMRLRNCTIYSNVEPCPMCSFPIREARISRVVFAIKSPIMGGFSRWNVLRNGELSNVMPEAFAEPPEVVSGPRSRSGLERLEHGDLENHQIPQVLYGARGIAGSLAAGGAPGWFRAQPAGRGISIIVIAGDVSRCATIGWQRRTQWQTH